MIRELEKKIEALEGDLISLEESASESREVDYSFKSDESCNRNSDQIEIKSQITVKSAMAHYRAGSLRSCLNKTLDNLYHKVYSYCQKIEQEELNERAEDRARDSGSTIEYAAKSMSSGGHAMSIEGISRAFTDAMKKIGYAFNSFADQAPSSASAYGAYVEAMKAKRLELEAQKQIILSPREMQVPLTSEEINEMTKALYDLRSQFPPDFPTQPSSIKRNPLT